MDNTLFLQMKNISKDFAGVLALDDVSISVGKGQILALLGENGAGKSTLMKILSGVYGYGEYSGEIYIDGELKKYSDPAMAGKNGVAMIYQELNPFLDLSIAENIFMGLYPTKFKYSVKWKEMQNRASKILSEMNLDVDVTSPLRFFGASHQQIVAIARAIARDAKILALDEPTSSLTEQEVAHLFSILNKLKAQGKSIIYISHKLQEINEITDMVCILRDGKNSGTFETKKTSADKIVKAMIGRNVSDMYPKKDIEKGDTFFEIKNFTVWHSHVKKIMISDINIHLKKGEIVGLAGLVGSGRSETLSSIFGSYSAEHTGEIYLDGNKIDVKNPKQAKRLGIGFMTEDRRKNGLVGIMDITQNITLPSLEAVSKMFRIIRKSEKSVSEKYINDMKIKCNTAKTLVMHLSGGNQQKVVLSKWLNTNPKLLLLDEPTRGIDVGAKVEIYNLMNALSEAGIGIIWVSSELPELMAMSDRLYIFAGGKVRRECIRGEISQEEVLSVMAS